MTSTRWNISSRTAPHSCLDDLGRGPGPWRRCDAPSLQPPDHVGADLVRGVAPPARGRSPTPRPRAATPAAAVASCQRGSSMSVTSHSEAARASSMAASMSGSASTRRRPTRTGAGSATAKPGLEKLHAAARGRPRRGPWGPRCRSSGTGATPRRERPAPCRLEPGRAAARGGDPHRPARVAAEGDVGLERGHRHRRAARRAPGHEAGVEGVHRRPVPRVHPRHPQGQLVEVGPAHDAGSGRPGAGQARGVPRRRRRPRSATARHPAVVGTPSMSIRSFTASRTPGARRVEARDERRHCPSLPARRASTVARRIGPTAPMGAKGL